MKTNLYQVASLPDRTAWSRIKTGITICPKLVYALVLLAFSPALKAVTSTYYVDFATGSDSNTSTQAQSQSTPWKHAPGMDGATSNANSYSVKSGDVFVLKGGSTWTTVSTINDLWTIPASNITIRGGQQLSTPWGSGYPILNGTGSTNTRGCIVSSGKSNVTIDGIKCYGACNTPDGSGYGIAAFYGSGGWEIVNCYVDSCGANGITYSPSSGSSFLFHNSTVINCGRVYLAFDAGVTFDNVQIYNNNLLGPGTWPAHNYHADGIMIGSASNTDPSPLTNVQIYNNKFAGDWSQGATALIYLNNGSGSSGWTVGGGYHCKIYNNQMCMDSKGWLSPGFISIFNGWRDVQIFNNTMNAVTTGGTPVSVGIAVQSCGTAVALVAKNNIISGCTYGVSDTDAGVRAGSGLTLDNNLYQTNANGNYIQDSGGTKSTLAACQAAGYESHGLTVSSAAALNFTALPNGTNGSGNWTILSTSPAKSTGLDLTSLGIFTSDITGSQRTPASWDIGASSYSSGVTSIIAPSNAAVNVSIQ